MSPHRLPPTLAYLWCLLMGPAACLAPSHTVPSDAPGGPLRNGGFEAYDFGWWHPADRYGGTLDPAVQHRGLYAWRMDLDAHPDPVYLSTSTPIVPRTDHALSLWIRSDSVDAQDAVRVRVQQFTGRESGGWIRVDGSNELIRTGGSHGWQRFAVRIPASAFDRATDNVTVYLRAEAGARGTVWFDDVSFGPPEVQPIEEAEEAPKGSDAPSPRRPREATAFLPPRSALRIDTGTDHNLFYGDEPAYFTLRAQAPGATLSWEVVDYSGTTVLQGERDAGGDVSVEIPGFGYFDVRARLTYPDGRTAHDRTSMARMMEHPAAHTAPSFPLGTWVQQDDLVDDFGSRWTRIGPGWRYLEPSEGVAYQPSWDNLDQQIARFKQAGIEPIFLFTGVPAWAGPNVKLVDDDHWESLRAYARKVVERYADQIDVWETMNEPYIPELFSGTNDDILRWHRVIREEVDRGDPGALVIGPCLNPRDPVLFAQLRDLLDRGLGELIDGVSIHTYGGLEADGFLDDLAALRGLLASYGLGHYPIYITEHGLSFPEEPPLERAQAQHLARTVLLSMEAGVTALIWHMLSWPQGDPAREREFAVVRARTGNPQRAPRPAFVAAATVATVLGKARYAHPLPGFGPTTGAQVYDDDGAPILALWEWGRPLHTVELDVGVEEVTLVDIVGKRTTRFTEDGRLTLTLTPDPVYILGAGPGLLRTDED